LSKGHRLLGSVASILAVVAIGWIDYLTGPELGLSLLYLVPITVAAWYGDMFLATVAAILASATWLSADLAFVRADVTLGISLWNGFTRLVIYTGAAILVALLRRDQDRLRALVASEAALARTDSITGLPNARAFSEVLQAEIDAARTSSSPLCVIYIDLDHFKAVNDLFGHAAGDAVLEEVGRVLTHVASGRGIAARVGGDEFAMMLRGMDAESGRSAAGETIDRIRAIGAVYDNVGFGATAGVVCLTDPMQTVDDMLRAGDEAMYQGKLRGKGKAVVAGAPPTDW